jgi:hypothetical protein
MRNLLLAGVACLGLVTSAHATDWLTIVSDRGCVVSWATPDAFAAALKAKGYPVSFKVHNLNGQPAAISITDTEPRGEFTQWFFASPQVCVDMARFLIGGGG